MPFLVCSMILVCIQRFSRMAHLKKGHHQVSYTEINHEKVHRSVVLASPQQNPQHKAVAQCGERQDQAQDTNLCLRQCHVPHPGCKWGISGPRWAVLQQPEIWSATIRTVQSHVFTGGNWRGVPCRHGVVRSMPTWFLCVSCHACERNTVYTLVDLMWRCKDTLHVVNS